MRIPTVTKLLAVVGSFPYRPQSSLDFPIGTDTAEHTAPQDLFSALMTEYAPVDVDTLAAYACTPLDMTTNPHTHCARTVCIIPKMDIARRCAHSP